MDSTENNYGSQSQKQNNFPHLEIVADHQMDSKDPCYMSIEKPVSPSAFLAKRLQRKPKFFDSGDYQMAKQNVISSKNLFETIGVTIPTPETVSALKSYHIELNTSSWKDPNSDKSKPKQA
ncbi:alpha-endosulfine-like [Drosophila navojoa]|uniref:alpha-endosulfine-like n=1 Tax=Drosophila navojoa TaxID=7232 RepID=UPI000847927A|nr:alpha-endosulfine-like [Drosophila navojoa]